MIQTKFQGQTLLLNKDKHHLTYSLNDFYKVYKNERKDDPHLTRKDYVKAMKRIFELIADEMIYEKNPYNPRVGLGRFGIIKKKSGRRQLDYPKTLELGKPVYHTNRHTGGYHFEFKWEKMSYKCNVRNKKYYRFKPVKAVKKKLATHIKELANDPYKKGYDCLSQLPVYEQA